MSETKTDTADRSESNDEQMVEPIRNAACQLIDERRGIYINPDFIRPKHLAEVLETNYYKGDADLELSPFSGSIEFVEPIETRPPKVNRVLKLNIDGVKPPLWATYSEATDFSIEARTPYWRCEGYTDPRSEEGDSA